MFDGGGLVAEEDAHEELFSDFKVTTFLEHAAIGVEGLDKVRVHFKNPKITILSRIKLLKLLEECGVVKVGHRVSWIDFSCSLEVSIGPDEEGTVAELLGVSQVAVFFLQGRQCSCAVSQRHFAVGVAVEHLLELADRHLEERSG